MKTTKLFFMAALALMTAACSNSDNDILTPAEQPANNMVTITAKLAPKSGSAQTRVLSDQTTYIKAEWAATETMKIISANGKEATATVKSVDGSGTATIAFSIDAAAVGQNCTIIYPASAAVTESAGVYTAQPMTAQTGTLSNDLDVRIGKGTISDATTLDVTTQPAAQFAIWKLTLQDNAATPTALSATQVSVKVGGATPVTIASTATLGSATSAVYLAVPGVTTPSTLIIEATTAGGTYKYEKGGVSLALGKYYQSTVMMAKAVPEGAINGRFSVSDTKKVYFSKGNLQATYNTSWSWAFATNQWDCIGNAAGNTSINGVGTISGTGTVDLFGWVGAACEWTGAAQYGISNVTAAAQYGNVEGEALKSDWGTLAITNGGNTANFGWYSLASSEWEYLFKTRTTPSGVRYAHATVNSVPGLVLLPDDWSTDYYSLNKVNNATGTAYTDNVISSSDWTSKLEAHGAVFLPAGGYRNGATVSDAGVQGTYWSSTPGTSQQDAGNFFFRSTVFWGDTSSAMRNRGYSVRLVYNAN